MHDIRVSAVEVDRLLPPDVWKISLSELEHLTQGLVGPTNEGWLRQGDQSALVASQKRGCLATKLSDEFVVLTGQVDTLLAEKTCDAALRAAAFFHLRFENIHPLRDGNGRVGRTLLAAQCGRSYNIPISEVIAQLEAYRNGYRRVFGAPQPELQFELLIDLLARVFALPTTENSGKLPFPTEPIFLDPKPLPTASAMAERSADKIHRLLPPDLWKPSLSELEQLAQGLLGFSSEGWLRQGWQSALIAGQKRGTLTPKLSEEFTGLGEQIDIILTEKSSDAALRAAAFFHLRFENIHPLREGNGRAGRILLAAQCGQSYHLPIREVIAKLAAHPKDYRQIFAAPRPEIQFEQLTGLIVHALALPAMEHMVKLPFPLEPIFPDRLPIPTAPRS